MTAYSFIIFFFSSRRRHTRFDCDWSSDVCSSDLLGGALSDRIGPARTMWIGWLSYVALAAGMWLAARPLAGRESTPLNSRPSPISYAVFCLKKKIIVYVKPRTLLVIVARFTCLLQ